MILQTLGAIFFQIKSRWAPFYAKVLLQIYW